jgi:hypothetical protein
MTAPEKPTVQLLMNEQRASLFATDPPYLVDDNDTNHPHKWTKAHGHKFLAAKAKVAEFDTIFYSASRSQ